eukprot:gnl/Trimastix_PCT/3010.p1 GENE.gnl/Trimastix_PCT/3010~~gnl/Trimastix_PCT/3010.p1  ORF type:complete len:869 (+),score=11.58 gnl/Trimastix_PCT/3010:20-2626(+)
MQIFCAFSWGRFFLRSGIDLPGCPMFPSISHTSLNMRMLILFVLVIFSHTVSCEPRGPCDPYDNCMECVQNPLCHWCGNTEDCILKASQCRGGCVKTEKSQCPAITCGTAKSCANCTSNGCVWCGLSNVCHEIDHTSHVLCAGLCDHCRRTFPSGCPRVNRCESQRSCRSCTRAGCVWCGATQRCDQYDGVTGLSCEGRRCPACRKFYESECPAVEDCSGLHECNQCLAANCLWCSDTHTCIERSAQDATPCKGDCLRCPRSVATQCPASNCTAHDSCRACVSANCLWCGMTQTCKEHRGRFEHLTPLMRWGLFNTYTNTPQPQLQPLTYAPAHPQAHAHPYTHHATPTPTNDVRTNGAMSCDGSSCQLCAKTMLSECPVVPKCSQMTSCEQCTRASCLWCNSTQTCLEGNTGGIDCQGLCPEGTTRECGCERLTSCRACTQGQPSAPGQCLWCSDQNRCLLGTVDYGPVRPSIVPCLWKASVEECPMCRLSQSCKECLRFPNCIWCGDEQRCLDPTEISTPQHPCRCMQHGPATNCTVGVLCDAFHQCDQCTQNGCLWHAPKRMCVEPSRGSTGVQVKGCWPAKERAEVYRSSQPQCKVDYCSRHGACGNCTQAGCVWCGGLQKCQEHGTPCPGCDKSLPSQCPQCRDGSAPCTTPIHCPSLHDCVECVRSGCAWCNSTGRCLETDAHKHTTCSPCAHTSSSCLCSARTSQATCLAPIKQQGPSGTSKLHHPPCGWCWDGHGGDCLLGSATGPFAQACSGSWAWTLPAKDPFPAWAAALLIGIGVAFAWFGAFCFICLCWGRAARRKERIKEYRRLHEDVVLGATDPEMDAWALVDAKSVEGREQLKRERLSRLGLASELGSLQAQQ